MSHPRREHRPAPAGPPHGLGTLPSAEEDLGPTGEHDAPGEGLLEISNGDLEPVETSAEALDAVPTPVHSPPPASRRAPSPNDRTMPPERAHYAPESEGEPLDEAELEPVEEMESAPTRVERAEDVSGTPSGESGPRVLIIGGNNRGKEFPLKAGDNSLGRGVDNDVVLADIAVSRKHTLICFEGDHFVVRDLGSGNGTLLNGKRVQTHRLQDGDQLELGNTLLRFVHGGAAPLAQLATVITPREVVDGAGEAPELTPSTEQPAPAAKPTKKGKAKAKAAKEITTQTPAPNRTRKLVIFGSISLLVFLGAMIGVKVLLSSRKSAAVAAAAKAGTKTRPDEIAAREFRDGVTQFNAKSWERAREHFLKVLTLAPNQKEALQRYIDQATAEIAARDALERARSSLAVADFKGARREIAKVKADSKYRDEATTLGARVDEEEVSKLVATARALREGGDTSGALDKVKEAQAIAPTNSAVKQLHAELSEGSGGRSPAAKAQPKAPLKTAAVSPKAQPRVAPKVAPKAAVRPPRGEPPEPAGKAVKVPPGAAKNAIALYKKRQWAQAYQAMRAVVDGLKGRKQKAAKAVSDAMYSVAQNWQRGDQAGHSNFGQAMGYYQRALADDARIERGHHQKALRELVVKMAKQQAVMAFTRRDYRGAFAAIKVAERNGAKGDPVLKKVLTNLEQKADEIFTKAYTIRSSNQREAKRLWYEIIAMLPPSSRVYQKAYSWLNNSSSGKQDEDED